MTGEAMHFMTPLRPLSCAKGLRHRRDISSAPAVAFGARRHILNGHEAL
jgi:hypothetical protein